MDGNQAAQSIEVTAMQMILHSGNARSNLITALRECKENNYEKSKELLTEAEEMLSEAHKTHFHLIQKEASDESTDFSLLLMHAEDHLMSTTTMKEMIKELIQIFESR